MRLPTTISFRETSTTTISSTHDEFAKWLNTRDTRVRAPRPAVPFALDVTLTRDANAYLTRNVHVMHFEENGALNWIDAAGYLVATSLRPREWPPEPHRFHFQLDVDSASVSGSPYLQHQ